MYKFPIAAVVSVLALAAGTADALTFSFRFDGTADATVTDPIVGTGSFVFDGDPGNGIFALTSLSNYAFSFDFGGTLLDTADIATPAANVLVQISDVGGSRMVTFGGTSGGPFGGSLDFFESSSNVLSFQPGFGSLYFNGPSYGTFEAIATQAVPLPMSLPLMGAGLGVLALLRRRTA